ncbi:hypothetical protein VCHA53O466_140055 [Vibrio chagasii]|nr:hypothetical protein VCHA53O466_140055 [Vibrio chagasii]
MKSLLITAVSVFSLTFGFAKIAIAYEVEREAQYKEITAFAESSCGNLKFERDRAYCVIQHFSDTK